MDDWNDWNDSRSYGYAVSVGRRWPVRHHTQMGMEHTHRPRWWYPHRPNRRQYIWRRHYHSVWNPDCWQCHKGTPHPWWDCEMRSDWELRNGRTSSPTHQGLKATAQRKWRHTSKALLKRGDHDTLPYQSVGWAW